MTDPVRKRVVAHGRVQGVFYRDTCRRMAAEQGIAGWVRNLDDGSVEAVFEGPRAAVEAAVSWAAQGPRGADVKSLESYDEPPEGRTNFVVR